MKVLTAAEMREVDRRTMELGISGAILMVRRVVGVLVKVGLGEVTEAQFAQLLTGRCDKRLDVAAWTAPAAGLFLEKVDYTSRN